MASRFAKLAAGVKRFEAKATEVSQRMRLNSQRRSDFYELLGNFVADGLPLYDALSAIDEQYRKTKEPMAFLSTLALLRMRGGQGGKAYTFGQAIHGYVPVVEAMAISSGEEAGSPAEGLHRAAQIARAGLALVPEGRRLFPSLSVEENLRMGAGSQRPGPWDLDSVYALFPALYDKRRAPSGALSGGQQQQVAIGRGLMANPRVLLCDELSLGLSPAVVQSIYAQLPAITASGTALVLVEQNISLVLEHAHHAYVLREGRVVLEGAPATFDRASLGQAYFGVTS